MMQDGQNTAELRGLRALKASTEPIAWPRTTEESAQPQSSLEGQPDLFLSLICAIYLEQMMCESSFDQLVDNVH